MNLFTRFVNWLRRISIEPEQDNNAKEIAIVRTEEGNYEVQ